MSLYRRLKSWIWKWKAIRDAPLIMLISEHSVIRNMTLEDLTWTAGFGGEVIGVKFILQHSTKPVIYMPPTEKT